MRRLAILAATAAALACSAEKSPPPAAPPPAAAAPAPSREPAAPPVVPAAAPTAAPVAAPAPDAVAVAAPAPERVRPAATPATPPQIPQVPQAGTHARIGPDRCRGCHKVQHQSWAQSEHARKGLDCESCHGNGADYFKVMKDRQKSLAGGLVMPDLSFCKRCHARADPSLLPRAHAHKP